MKLTANKGAGYCWLENSTQDHVADFMTEEHAKHIAMCVNAHDELVKALERVLMLLQDPNADEFTANRVETQIRNALAKVKP